MKEKDYFCWLSQRVKNTRGATYAQHTRNLCAMLLVLFMGIGQMWANQTDLVSSVTLPDIPASTLDMASQTTYTADANGWIVFNPYAVTETWWKVTSKSSQSAEATADAISGLTTDAPFTASNTSNQKINFDGNYAAAIRFTGATDVSFLVHPRSSKTFYVGLYSYDGESQVLVEEKNVSGNAVNVINYSSLTASTNYIAYFYGKVKQNMSLIDIAIKKPVSTTPAAPTITVPATKPELAEITLGETEKFSITATGYPAPSYQWQTCNEDGTGAVNIDEATAASYTTLSTLVVGTYYFKCVVTNSEGTATSPVFSLKVNPLGADLTAHTPGVYTKAQASGGYGATLINVDDREYETYYIYNNSGLYLTAGNIECGSTGAYEVITKKNATNGDAKADWVAIKANSITTSVTPNTNQFNINKSTAYVKMRNTNEAIRLKVSGYDQFAFYGKNNSSSDATKQFTITIDGVAKENPHKSNNSNNIFAFDLTTGEHYIEVSVGGNTSSDCQFFAISLRLPAVAKHSVTYDLGDGTGTAPTQDDVKEGATFEVASGAGLTPPDGKEFDKWNDGTSDYSAGDSYTMGTSDVTLTAVWKDHETSDDATLSDLTVGGETVTGFAAATTAYNVELPFGTNVVPTVAGTANSTFAKSVVVTPAASLPGSTTVVVTAENNSTKTYTINFTVASSKLIDLVWKTGQSACDGAGSQAAVINSSNAAVSTYIKPISFENAEGTGDNAAEGGSLNTGKKAGNVIIIQTKPSYLFTAMSFFGKIEEADTKCQISIDGGATWSDLASTSGGDAKYCNVVSGASTSDIRIKGCGSAGTWIRNMQLTITTGCSPVTLAWAAAPATEVEVGKAASVSAVANNGTVGYASNATDVIEVASDGALTVKALGSATITASVGGGDGTLYCTEAPSNITATMNAYYLVEFDAQGGDAVLEDVKYFSGDAALTAPSAGSLSGFDFDGWYDAATGGNAISWPLTPAASQKIYAHWTAQCAGPTITVQPVGANYIIGRDADAISCTATAGNGGALTYVWYEADAEDVDGVALASAPVISTAAAMDKYYYCIVTEAGCGVEVKSNVIHVVVAPKDGVSIIKVTAVGGKKGEVTGLYAGDGAVSLSSSNKMDSEKYIGFTLEGTTLQAGDQINVHTTEAANTGGSHIIFYDNMTDKNELYETGEIGGEGDNIFTINAAMVGQASAYVYRSSADNAHKWNGYVDYIEVKRPMNPVLTAITINGCTGEIDENNDKHFTVTIPNDANLASLTVVPTIVRNAPHATTPEQVMTNEGAWVLTEDGDNTYRIMDKDGDYTDYTITLVRDVLKHNVSFNTHGGSSIDAIPVVANGYLAAAPANPTKEDYEFQYWSLTEDGAEVDVTSVQITEPKTFHAVWAPEVAYKLIVDDETPGTKKINNVDYFTGVSMNSVTISEVEHACVKLAGGASAANAPYSVGYAKDRVIAYNAKTTETKIKITAYSSSTNERKFTISVVEEGQAASDAYENTILVDMPKDKSIMTTDFYTFSSSKNRTIYITIPGNNNDYHFLQVKAVESGEDLKKAGELGYSMNFNKGRMIGPKQTLHANFEGFDFYYNNQYQVLQSTSMVISNAENDYIKFHSAAVGSLAISAESAGVFYVTKDAKGTANETTAINGGTVYVDIDAADKDWYITPKGGDVKITKIEFLAPKCAEPAINNLANSELCEGDAFTALNGTATVDDAGTPIYQWYNADGDVAIEGATNATYTPTADGSYYVIATNQLAGYSDNAKKSETVTVKHFAAAEITTAPANVRKDADAEATLTVVATGKDLHYTWKECETIDGTYSDVAGAADAASLNVTVPSGVKYYKVVVSSACGDAVEAIAKVEEWVELPQVDVTENTVWDWENAGENIKLTGETTPKKNEEGLMANIRVNGVSPRNDDTFNSQALLFYGENVRANDGGRLYASVGHISFHTTVQGIVSVEFSDNGTNNRRLSINGKLSESSTGKTDVKTFSAVVPAGDVVLMGVASDGTGTNQYIRISKIEFMKVDYTRDVTVGRLGTICLPNGGKMYGADLYEVAYFDASAKKIFFDEILSGEMEAGMPYVFLPNGTLDKLAVAYTDEVGATAGNKNGLYGSYTQEELATDGTNYILINNQYCRVVEARTYVGENRAYIKLNEIGTTSYSPAPGRRRISMGVQSEQVATGIENTGFESEAPRKVLINGELFIIRGEKIYDAKGQLVK